MGIVSSGSGVWSGMAAVRDVSNAIVMSTIWRNMMSKSRQRRCNLDGVLASRTTALI